MEEKPHSFVANNGFRVKENRIKLDIRRNSSLGGWEAMAEGAQGIP